MRIFLTKAFLALAITTVAAFGADNTIGTWKLNVEKSKYTPAPMPLKSLTVTREASDGGVKVTATGDRTDGTAINSSYTANTTAWTFRSRATYRMTPFQLNR